MSAVHRCGARSCTEDHGEHDRTLLQLLGSVVRRLVRCDTDRHLDARRRHGLVAAAPPLTDAQLAAGLRRLAVDGQILWNVARLAIEDELVERRDAGLSVGLRNNGLVIASKADSTPSDVIRLGPEQAVHIALLAMAEHLEDEAEDEPCGHDLVTVGGVCSLCGTPGVRHG